MLIEIDYIQFQGKLALLHFFSDRKSQFYAKVASEQRCI